MGVMKANQNTLPEEVNQLQEMVAEQSREIRQIESENKVLREELRLLRQKMYGSSSEKMKLEGEAQPGLPFPGEPETIVDEEEAIEEEREEIAYTRRKRGRRPLPADLPRQEIIHEVPEAERMCCGEPMAQIGQETSERLVKQPAILSVEVHVRRKYACRHCHGEESQKRAVVIAPAAPQLVPKSLASESLLADMITAKFADGLPYYRQERQYERLGIDLGRDTMSNLTIKVWDRCSIIESMLFQELHSGPLIQMDETPVQVLDEEGRSPKSLSYMWACRGGPPDKPVVFFRYAPSRSGEVAKALLGDFRGYVQTDGYGGYDFLDKKEGVVHVGCWVHARRKFMEANQAGGNKKDSKAAKVLRWIWKLYENERESVDLAPEERLAIREKKSQPIIEEIEEWLTAEAAHIVPKSLLGIAIAYLSSQWPRLQHFLKNPIVPLDTNRIENDIRPFVVGRKNWLFSKSTNGAHATAFFYSIIETAKANGLEPYSYLNRLFTGLLTAKTNTDYLALLPQYVDRSGLTLFSKRR
jgi:transposase